MALGQGQRPRREATGGGDLIAGEVGVVGGIKVIIVGIGVIQPGGGLGRQVGLLLLIVGVIVHGAGGGGRDEGQGRGVGPRATRVMSSGEDGAVADGGMRLRVVAAGGCPRAVRGGDFDRFK